MGPLPDMVAFNKACDKIAVANEGEGVYGDAGLVDPEGSVSIISLDNGGSSGTVQTVSFAPIATSDEDLKAKGVHLPLELKAQEYYDLHSAKFSGDLDFAASRAAHAQHAERVPGRRATLQPYPGYHMQLTTTAPARRSVRAASKSRGQATTPAALPKVAHVFPIQVHARHAARARVRE